MARASKHEVLQDDLDGILTQEGARPFASSLRQEGRVTDLEMLQWGPDRAEGVRRYVEHLGKGVGVGYGYSKRMIDRLGPDKLVAALDKQPEILRAIGAGFDPSEIAARWAERTAGERAAMMTLLSFKSIRLSDAVRIYALYGGEHAMLVVQHDPYQLSLDIDNLGFERADQIALEGGASRTSQKRLRAALFHALGVASEEGDSYVSRRDWIGKAEFLLGSGYRSFFAAMIEVLVTEGYVYEVLVPGTSERVYATRAQFRHESRLARRLRALAATSVTPLADLDACPTSSEMSIDLSDEQHAAIRRASENALSIVTGGPGTGKTALVKALCGAFESAGLKVSLAAFAGCAAKRLRESTGHEALTIHKTLLFDPTVERFSKNESEPLEADVVVLDEVSMIDMSLLDHATQAVAQGSRLVLVGDVDQLPSIGPGAALRDVISSGIAPVTRLETVFRQSLRSRIVSNSRRILRGQRPVPAVVVGAQKFDVIERIEDPDSTLGAGEALRDYIDVPIAKPEGTPSDVVWDPGPATCDAVVRLLGAIEKRYGIPAREVQVLCPMRVRSGGADELNQALQAALNPQPNSEHVQAQGKKNLQIGNAPRETVAVGDKIMQLRNDYGRELFNGDIGFVTAIGPSFVEVDFHDGKPARRFEREDCKHLRLAYASTIHKSQGSEYPCVVLVMLRHQAHMFSRSGRNLFYTAVTRGKKLVFVVHDGAVDRALGQPVGRRTLLAERLRGEAIRYRSGGGA